MTLDPWEITRAGRCCWQWQRIASSNVIWKPLYLSRWGKPFSESSRIYGDWMDSSAWKQAFVDLDGVERIAKAEAERIAHENLLHQKAQNAYEELSNFYDEVDDEDLVFD